MSILSIPDLVVSGYPLCFTEFNLCCVEMLKYEYVSLTNFITPRDFTVCDVH